MKLSLFEIVNFLTDDDNCLFIAIICLGVYLWIGIVNLILELASEARSHKSPEVTSEGECFAPPPSDFMKRLRVKQVSFDSAPGAPFGQSLKNESCLIHFSKFLRFFISRVNLSC